MVGSTIVQGRTGVTPGTDRLSSSARQGAGTGVPANHVQGRGIPQPMPGPSRPAASFNNPAGRNVGRLGAAANQDPQNPIWAKQTGGVPKVTDPPSHARPARPAPAAPPHAAPPAPASTQPVAPDPTLDPTYIEQAARLNFSNTYSLKSLENTNTEQTTAYNNAMATMARSRNNAMQHQQLGAGYRGAGNSGYEQTAEGNIEGGYATRAGTATAQFATGMANRAAKGTEIKQQAGLSLQGYARNALAKILAAGALNPGVEGHGAAGAGAAGAGHTPAPPSKPSKPSRPSKPAAQNPIWAKQTGGVPKVTDPPARVNPLGKQKG